MLHIFSTRAYEEYMLLNIVILTKKFKSCLNLLCNLHQLFPCQFQLDMPI